MIKHETDGFVHLRDGQGKIVSLYRVEKKESAEDNNKDPFQYYKKKCESRRKPQSAPPLADFLLEAWRNVYYPTFPSRQFSIFANLNDYQTIHMKEGKSLFLVVPHRTATVSISAVIDFFLSISEKENLYQFVKANFKEEYLNGFDFDSEKMLEYKNKFEKCEHEPFLKILDAFKNLKSMAKASDLGADFMECLMRWHDADHEELKPLLSFWKNSELAENLNFSGRGIGNEVIIQGPVRYVAVEPWK